MTLAPSHGERAIYFLPTWLSTCLPRATCSPAAHGGMPRGTRATSLVGPSSRGLRPRCCPAWRDAQPVSGGVLAQRDAAQVCLGAEDRLPGQGSQFRAGEGPSGCASLQVDGKGTLLPQSHVPRVPKELVGVCYDPTGQLCSGVSGGAGAAALEGSPPSPQLLP